MSDWPDVDLDPVRRLRVLAAALPHVAYDEVVFDAPFDRVWGLVGDLVGGVPQFELAVQSAEVLERSGDKLKIATRTPLGITTHFDVELRPGWCVMRSRFGEVGMAARPEEGGRVTRFAHFEGSAILRSLAKPLLRRNIAGDFRRIAELVGGRS